MEPGWLEESQGEDFIFSRRTAERGRAYYEEGRVELTRVEPDRIVAEVQGTRRYEVEFEFDLATGAVASGCTCPASRREPCKHEFAVLLAVGQLTRAGLMPSGKSDWKARLDAFDPPVPRDPWTDVPGATVRAVLVLCPETTRRFGTTAVRAMLRRRLRNGGWSVPKQLPGGLTRLRFDEQSARWFEFAAEGEERVLDEALPAGMTPIEWDGREPRFMQGSRAREVLVAAARGGALYLGSDTGGVEGGPLPYDEGGPWRFSMRIDEGGGSVRLSGSYVRGERRVSADTPALLCDCGVMVLDGELAEVDYAGGWRWAEPLRQVGALELPSEARGALVARLRAHGNEPPVEGGLPEAEPPAVPPKPALYLKPKRVHSYSWLDDFDLRPGPGPAQGLVTFQYGGSEVEADAGDRLVVDPVTGEVCARDLDAERAALARLVDFGVTPGEYRVSPVVWVPENRTLALARALRQEGWTVDTQELGWREPDDVSFKVTSDIDWFELQGGVRFGDESIAVPELLRAVRSGQESIRLAGGELGLLPEDLGERFGLLPDLGEETDGGLRFRPNQAWLLDSLLAESEASVDTDAEFERRRRGLARFDSIRPRKAGRGFRGELRPYQQDALGWLRFLERVGLGGCLADDMGLGKTVMVLAHLLHHRAARRKAERKPALVVAPKSLVWNWIEEARKFAPSLAVLEYGGPAAQRDPARIPEHDIAVTTYGVLRRDAHRLKDVPFGYAVLDEAQAVKNPASQTWKAARLLDAEHRLALTGTPVENHLGDLWAIMELVNPGLLGPRRTHAAWAKASRANGTNGRGGTNGREARDGDAFRERVARMVRPILLRRTKEEVLPELPARQETVLFCEMGPKQRRAYDELLDHYRRSLLGRVDEEGLDRSRMHVLEALLRLRQAACHPGLLDTERRRQPAAKFDTLLPRLEEVAERGRKALVFSQFTSLLALLREELARTGLEHAYLDGTTRNRKDVVQRFQASPDLPLFLISLKAGGSGLNLTAADHVFLLDPWWNPAVERQAVDRTHRIGQTDVVNVYKIVTRDTIEERILELQDRKRDLAAAITDNGTGSGSANPLHNITRDDLAELLGG